MHITETKPHGAELTCTFHKDAHVKYYLWTQRPGFQPKISYYIVEQDSVRGLCNKNGDFLYDVTDIAPDRVLMMVELRSFYNWRNYGKPRKLPTVQTQHTAMSWAKQCIDKCNGNIVLWLTNIRPGVTYQEAESVMRNEGYIINKDGFLEPNPEMRQI